MRDVKSGRFEASDIASRFWSKVDQTGDCWLWIGQRMWQGYGTFWAGRTRRAHRVAWELANGEIPAGLEVLHRCDNPSCVRPAHLFVGTQADNMADKVSKGRAATGCRSGAYTHPESHPRGERHGMAKLSWAAVREIREQAANGVPRSELMRRHGIGKSQAHRIITGRSWKEAAGGRV